MNTLILVSIYEEFVNVYSWTWFLFSKIKICYLTLIGVSKIIITSDLQNILLVCLGSSRKYKPIFHQSEMQVKFF